MSTPDGLSASDQQVVAQRAWQVLDVEADNLVHAYLDRFGRAVNADTASELFADYAATTAPRRRPRRSLCPSHPRTGRPPPQAPP